MGFLKPKTDPVVNQTVPQPEKTAEPSQIGGTRKAEDEQLFGTEGQTLRVDRNVPASVGQSGSGLKLM